MNFPLLEMGPRGFMTVAMFCAVITMLLFTFVNITNYKPALLVFFMKVMAAWAVFLVIAAVGTKAAMIVSLY